VKAQSRKLEKIYDTDSKTHKQKQLEQLSMITEEIKKKRDLPPPIESPKKISLKRVKTQVPANSKKLTDFFKSRT
jgi:hypothetical protein